MRFTKIKRRTEIKKGQIDIAPMIDVVFLLLIFFMLTSNFILQPGISVNLPKAMTSEVLNNRNLVITLSGQDLLYLEEAPTTVGELKNKIREAAQDGRTVLLKADTSASLGRVVELWDLCREMGVSQINIATNQKPPERV